jgi:hypothetical protein
VIGSRAWTDERLAFDTLDAVDSRLRIDVVVSGGAAGADSLGERWALARGREARIYRPDWKRGRGAGFERNSVIAEDCDALVAFWDGRSRGTLDTLKKAHGKPRLVVQSATAWWLYGPGEELA